LPNPMTSPTKPQAQALEKLQAIVNKYGYWSKEVADFNGSIEYSVMNWANNHVIRFPKT